MKTGQANLPLHGGSCPPWLFDRMKKLGTAIVETMLVEFSTKEVLRRVSDPAWFQSLGCLLGFDWHSSGLTTVLCGALKEGLNPRAHELGLLIAGGKGAESRNTPQELQNYADEHASSLQVQKIQKTSRMVAQVDSSAVQDGFTIYHHSFFISQNGSWAVVQQGINQNTGMARRYHWLDEDVGETFVEEPHSSIASPTNAATLNLTDSDSRENRNLSTDVAREDPVGTLREFKKIIRSPSTLKKTLDMPQRHDIPRSETMDRVLGKIYENHPKNFEELLDIDNVGPKTVRALSMIAEVVWGKSPSYKDPVRYSYAHGGKDGYPNPVNTDRYDQSIKVLKKALRKSSINQSDKKETIDRLDKLRKLSESDLKHVSHRREPEAGIQSRSRRNQGGDKDDQLSMDL